jgi:MFS family permease
VTGLVGDTVGRRRLLMVMGLLMALMGLALITSQSLPLLAVAAFLGSFSAMIGASGAMGPFEQASLAATAAPQRRTDLFALLGMVVALLYSRLSPLLRSRQARHDGSIPGGCPPAHGS